MLRVLLVNYSFAHMWLKSFYTNFNVRLIKTFNIKSISVNDYKDEHQQLTSRKLLNPFFHGNNDSAEFKPVILHAKQLFCFYAVFFLIFPSTLPMSQHFFTLFRRKLIIITRNGGSLTT